MRKLDEIIIHATATNPSWYLNRSVVQVVAEITRWHTQERGWRDCGYHYIIHRSGEIGEARPLSQSGAHCRGKNKTTVGISLVGGRGGCKDDKFSEHYTPEQEKSLRELVEDLKKQYKIKKISGHQDYANKACPCFDVKEFMAA